MNTQQQPHLSAAEVRRLTLWKWQYQAESMGFTTEQAARLLFWRWYARRRKGVTG